MDTAEERTHRKRFWRHRFHDIAAISLLWCSYSWLWDVGSVDWKAQLGFGYNKSIVLFTRTEGTWLFRDQFLTQGRHPFHMVFGGAHGGFELVLATNNSEWRGIAALPYWFVVGVLALPLLISFAEFLREMPDAISRIRRWVIAKRFRSGHCPECGYDLRATPDRCPECGLIVSAST